MSEALWSLAADIQTLRLFPGRFFAPPLAGFVPSGLAQQQDPFALPSAASLPSPSIYACEDRYVHDVPNNRTTDVVLRITATRIGSAFPLEIEHPDLPPPAIRLHAVTKGFLRFSPAAGGARAQLILETLTFATYPASRIPWFQRWVEAHCVPRFIVYENVDVDHLQSYLRTIPSSGANGIKFPESKTAPIVDAASRDAFVAEFLLGNGLLAVEASAVVGQIAPTAVGASTFQLDLRAHYATHSAAQPRPMNPREFLYLLFGNQSDMATKHPLLQSLDSLPGGVPRTTKTTILRPPLRTWARLKWEAQIEAVADQGRPVGSRQWSQAGTLAAGTLFDTVFRRNIGGAMRGVSYAGLPANTPKCNIFTSDICVRAGFRTLIHEAGNVWHYPLSNAQAHAAVLALRGRAATPATRFPIMGDMADAGRLWGFAMTKFLLDGLPTAQMNAMMIEEGRAFIVAGARPRRPGIQHGTGHIVLLLTILDDPAHPSPTLVPNPDAELAGYPVAITQLDMSDAAQAASSGPDAGARTGNAQMICGGVAQNPGDVVGFIRIHLLEASPGGDPDLLQGLYDLHVRRAPPAQLGAPIDG